VALHVTRDEARESSHRNNLENPIKIAYCKRNKSFSKRKHSETQSNMKSSNSVATTTTTSMVDRNAVKDQIMEEANTNAPLSQTSQAPRGDEQQKKEQSRGKWAHNPFVLSLIACSNMHDCDEVE
jgi:hypothetical protein